MVNLNLFINGFLLDDNPHFIFNDLSDLLLTLKILTKFAILMVIILFTILLLKDLFNPN